MYQIEAFCRDMYTDKEEAEDNVEDRVIYEAEQAVLSYAQSVSNMEYKNDASGFKKGLSVATIKGYVKSIVQHINDKILAKFPGPPKIFAAHIGEQNIEELYTYEIGRAHV